MTHSRFSAVAIASVLSVVAGCANGAETSDSPSPTPDTVPASVTPVTTVTTVTSTVVPDSTSEVDGVDGVGDDVLPLPPLPEVVTDETTPPPAPQPIPDWVPVSLTAVEGTAPFPAPPLPPGPVDLVDVAVEIDDLVSNAPGCASQCITSAVLRAEAIGAGATIAVTTNVSTKLTLWVSTTQIGEAADGSPAFAGSPAPAATSGVFTRSWNDEIDDLLPDTTYRAILRATDRLGHRRYLTGSIHTAHGQPSGDLVAEGGCLFQCITSGVVQPGSRYNTVGLIVKTEVPARLSVYVSTSEPGWIGGAPLLPADALLAPQSALGTSWILTATGLDGDTVYHVIVRAEDADGDVAHRIGQFRTAPAPPTRLLITIEHLYLSYDGDPGDRNQGDVAFAYGLLDDRWAVREGQRMDSGDNFVPSGARQWIIDVEQDAPIPTFGATVWEFDWDGHYEPSCWLTYRIALEEGPRYIDLCDARVSSALSGPMQVADLDELLRCSTYGFIEGEDNACLMLTSQAANEDYAQFMVLVSIETL